MGDSALAEVGAPMRDRALSIADVAKAVAVYYRVPLQALLLSAQVRGPTRITWIRHVAMYLARECISPRPAYTEVGAYFGRDHSSVLSGVRRVQLQATNRDWVIIREIQRRLEEGAP